MGDTTSTSALLLNEPSKTQYLTLSYKDNPNFNVEDTLDPLNDNLVDNTEIEKINYYETNIQKYRDLSTFIFIDTPIDLDFKSI